MLGKNPTSTSAAALTLALGIGATTAIFSAVNPILFEALPYPEAQQIISIWGVSVSDGTRSHLAFHTYREVAERARALEAVAVMKVWQPTLVGAAEPERLDGQFVSARYFRVLGVAPRASTPPSTSVD